MCTKPITIRNPKLVSVNSQFSKGNDKYFLKVPCGQCSECKQARILEYTTRCLYEHEDCICHGGYSYFDTLTYRSSCVPSYHGLMMFNREDITNFIKNVRNKFERHGLSSSDWKYFVTCEYGGETYRPHYHLLFFFHNSKLSPEDVDLIVKDTWHFGFTDSKLASLKVIDDVGAIRYVCGYVSKDVDFLKVLNDQKYSDFPTQFRKEWFRLYNRKFEYERITYSDLLHLLRPHESIRFLPFHSQSQGLGISILEKFSIDELLTGSLLVQDKFIGYKSVPLPSYIERKVFFDYDKDTKLYKLNELGVEKRVIAFKQSLDEFEQKTECIKLNYKNINIDKFKAHYRKLTKGSSSIEIDHSKLIGDFINFWNENKNKGKFAAYMLFYRNRNITTNTYITEDPRILTSLYNECLLNHPVMDDKPFYDDLYQSYNDDVSICNNLEDFKGFEDMANVLESIKFAQNTHDDVNKFKQEQISQNKLALLLFNS